MPAAFHPPFSFWRPKKRTGRGRSKRKNASRRTCAFAQVGLSTEAVLADCHQSWSLLPARAGLFPRIGFPRVYTAAVNVGGRRKARPSGPADAALARWGSGSGKRRDGSLETPNSRLHHAAGRDFPGIRRAVPPRNIFSFRLIAK